MKKVALILAIVSLSVVAKAQQFKYCELVGWNKFMSMKINIVVDSGQVQRSFLKDGDGDRQAFTSMIDGMNKMGKDGWEFVQAFVVTESNSNVYHWVLKKRK